MSEGTNYSLKVWLTSALLASLMGTLERFIGLWHAMGFGHLNQPIADLLFHNFGVEQLGTVPVNIALLFPVHIGLKYAITWFAKHERPLSVYKRHLVMIGVPLAVLPQMLLMVYLTVPHWSDFSWINYKDIILYSVYNTVAVLACIWFYKLKPSIDLPSTTLIAWKRAKRYSLKVWLTTLVVAPVIVVFLQRHPLRPLINYVQEYLWTVLGDLLFFLLPMLIFNVVTCIVIEKSLSAIMKKLLLIGQAIAVFLLCWWLCYGNIFDVNIFSDSQQMAIIAAYLVVIAFASLFYRLESLDVGPSNQVVMDEPDIPSKS